MLSDVWEATSEGTSGPGWLRPKGSWAGRHGPGVARGGCSQTAASVGSSWPHAKCSSPQPRAAAASCSSRTHTASTPPSPSPAREPPRQSHSNTQQSHSSPPMVLSYHRMTGVLRQALDLLPDEQAGLASATSNRSLEAPVALS